jgi:hypothetical protein
MPPARRGPGAALARVGSSGTHDTPMLPWDAVRVADEAEAAGGPRLAAPRGGMLR